MGYFRANERYLGGATAQSGVEPPWDVRAQEVGLAGQVRVAWRAPYTPVDGYTVCGQQDGVEAAWHDLLRVPGRATEALLHLGPGAWRLAVQACRGDQTSALAIADCGLRIADYGILTAAPDEAPALLPVPADPQPPPAPALPSDSQSAIRNPQSAIEYDWGAIDRALRENSAVLGRHGLFVRAT